MILLKVMMVMIIFPQAKYAGKQADKAKLAKLRNKVRQLTDKVEKAVSNAEVKK